jgi:hypothetical protein
MDKSALDNCYNATQKFKSLVDTYEQAMRQHEQDMRTYTAHLADVQDWEANRGKYAFLNNTLDELQNHNRKWKNCVPWLDAVRGRHHDWCTKDLGSMDYMHGGETGDGCWPGFGYGLCYYKPEVVREKYDIEKNKHRPVPVAQPLPPSAPGASQIQCCSQVVGSVSGSLDALVQECSQNLLAAMSKPEDTKPKESESASPEYASPVSAKPENRESTATQSYILYGVFAATTLLLSLVYALIVFW